jgi:MFS family permease
MLGRIKSLRVFSLGTCISLILFAVVDLDYMKAVFVIVCYFFMVPIYSVLNTYTPEMYPTKMRGVAMATVNAIIEIPGLITPFVGATLLSHPSKWLYPIVWSVVFFGQFCLMFGCLASYLVQCSCLMKYTYQIFSSDMFGKPFCTISFFESLSLRLSPAVSCLNPNIKQN